MGADILPGSLPMELRRATRDLHAAAEAHRGHAALLTGSAPMAMYLDQSAQTWLVQRAMDMALTAQRTHPQLAALVRDYHLRSEPLEAALRGSGRDPSAVVPLASTRGFLGTIEAGGGNAAMLFGILYVLEDSTNGGRLIGQVIKRAYGLADDTAVRWLNPHGAAQPERWRLFREALADLALSPEQHATVTRAARGTFSWAIGVLDELCVIHGVRSA